MPKQTWTPPDSVVLCQLGCYDIKHNKLYHLQQLNKVHIKGSNSVSAGRREVLRQRKSWKQFGLSGHASKQLCLGFQSRCLCARQIDIECLDIIDTYTCGMQHKWQWERYCYVTTPFLKHCWAALGPALPLLEMCLTPVLVPHFDQTSQQPEFSCGVPHHMGPGYSSIPLPMTRRHWGHRSQSVPKQICEIQSFIKDK